MPAMPQAKAEELAEGLNLDDDWTYVVRNDPKGSGKSVIDIYDEDGEFVGTL